jgi:hypothetical protein
MNKDFSNWPPKIVLQPPKPSARSQKKFARWLHENCPKTNDRWVEFTFRVRHTPDFVFEATMSDTYESCMNELAREMAIYAAGLPEESWNIIINPAKRRKKKQMRSYSPKDKGTS